MYAISLNELSATYLHYMMCLSGDTIREIPSNLLAQDDRLQLQIVLKFAGDRSFLLFSHMPCVVLGILQVGCYRVL